MLGRDYPRTTHQGWPVITIANTAGASNNNNLFFFSSFFGMVKDHCVYPFLLSRVMLFIGFF